MSSSVSTSPVFNQKLAPFAQNAWSRFDRAHLRLKGREFQEQIEQWARREARTFFHISAGEYQFVRIYSALARFANVQAGLQEQRDAKAEQNKVMNSTLYETVRVQKSPEFYQKKLEAFAPVAWTRYNPSNSDIANWARNEARTFFHLTDGAYPFVTAWNWLVTYGEGREEREEQDVRREVAQDFDTAVAGVFAEDGQATQAEMREGRTQLNRFLFGEREKWWDAFEAEAAEDMEEDAPSAESRFAYHCAKILSRRTGIRVDHIQLVVEGWVEAHGAR
jgi:hypothetical protein